MHSHTLRHVHKLALRNRRFEQRLVTNPREVLQRESVPEAEIRLVEEFAPRNAFALGLVIEKIEKSLYDFQDDPGLFN